MLKERIGRGVNAEVRNNKEKPGDQLQRQPYRLNAVIGSMMIDAMKNVIFVKV
jgi:hypothetical protein